jgi:quinol monooxygenase YgiN
VGGRVGGLYLGIERSYFTPGTQPSTVYVVRTTVPLDPECREDAKEVAAALVEHSRRESGTVRYDASISLGEPTTLHFFEQYEDAAALKRHTESDAYRRFNEALPDVAAGEIETVQFEVAAHRTATFTAEEAVTALDEG